MTEIKTTNNTDASENRLHDSYLKTRYFSCLNGLRFLSISAVLWHHSKVYGAIPEPIQILKRGYLGVDFFFVLSGFLITTLLLREADMKGKFSLSKFYIRRFLRIVPVYFFVVSSVSAYYIFIKGEHQYIEIIPFYYTFLSNFLISGIPILDITWSLSVEEQYYLIWPALLYFFAKKSFYPVFIVLFCINFAMVFGVFEWVGLYSVETKNLRFNFSTSTYNAILLGSFAAIMLHSERGFSKLYKALGSKWACIFAFCALFSLLQFLPPYLTGSSVLLVHTMMVVCLITIVIREDNYLLPILSCKPIARLGEISYGIYLYHLIAMHIAVVTVGRWYADSSFIVMAVYIVASVCLAEVSYRTLETYFRKLKPKP